MIRFPDPRSADEYGVVAVGGDLELETLIEAYRHGIFPWPIDDFPLFWFSPEKRAILEFDKLHVSRSLERARKKSALTFTFDKTFHEVITACARMKRPDQEGTWIRPDVIDAYTEFHRLGYAHSIEAWSGDRLVGGLYGVDVDGAFGGESMFYIVPNASKLLLLDLVDHLRERGLDWMDLQVMTPHMERLGATVISRDEFLDRLTKTRAKRLHLFPRA
ncbi:MAG TPA: leucyl/phenylalanyl-tRNA--protein transferase [Thermoanaerobaculia bacterium]